MFGRLILREKWFAVLVVKDILTGVNLNE